ncbi:MAG: penicillin-binding protein 2 [Caldilineales bacterium]
MANRSVNPRFRIIVVTLALLLALVTLATQLIRWQVLKREATGTAQEAGATTAAQRGPARGTITDIHGSPLAVDAYRWEMWVEPSRVTKGQEQVLQQQLSAVLGSDLIPAPDALLQALTKRQAGVVMLSRNASQAAQQQIAAWENPALGMRALPQRFYPQGGLAAHLIGFVNSQPQAYYGVEERYDTYLRSMPEPFMEASEENRAFYAKLPPNWQATLPSATGQDLVLTIDARMQYITEKVLMQALREYQAQSGTIIVMEPRTGAVLAMASLPAFDLNQYSAADPQRFADPAISSQYEPGSVFKIITMAAGIDAGAITPSTILSDSLSIEVGDRLIYNSNQRNYGAVTARQALVLSLNVPTAKVALQLGENRFYQYVQRFGFDQLTEVDLANEMPGSVKTPGDELWSQSDLATNAFGQGIAVTPLQMATATCAIANGGLLVRPHVVDSMVFRGRLERADRSPVRRVLKPESAAAIADMMTSVVEESSPLAGVSGYRVAGKTGTAQIPTADGYHATDTIHSFVGFVPAENPAFVALVKLDMPRAYAWADSTAAPTFAALANQLLPMLGIPPEETASLP